MPNVFDHTVKARAALAPCAGAHLSAEGGAA